MNITDFMELGDYAWEGQYTTVLELTAKRGLQIEVHATGQNDRKYASAHRYTPQQVHDTTLADAKAMIDRLREACREQAETDQRLATEPKPVCPFCDGAGFVRQSGQQCPDCNGRGWIAQNGRK